MNMEKWLRNAVVLIGLMVVLLVSLTGFGSSLHERMIQRKPVSLHNLLVVVGEERFVDNGDGTVTDMRLKIMWQKGDNGKQVTKAEHLSQGFFNNLRPL